MILNYKFLKFFARDQDCTQLQKLQYFAEVVDAENNRTSQVGGDFCGNYQFGEKS